MACAERRIFCRRFFRCHRHDRSLSYPLISLAGITRQLIAVRPSCREMEEFLAFDSAQDSGMNIEGLTSSIDFGEEDHVPLPRTGANYGTLYAHLQKGGKYLWKGPSGSKKLPL